MHDVAAEKLVIVTVVRAWSDSCLNTLWSVNFCGAHVYSIRFWWSLLSHSNVWHSPTSSANTNPLSRGKGTAKNG